MDQFKRKRVAKMKAAYEKLYRVNIQGIRDTTYRWQYKFANICASSADEVECDQESFAEIDVLLSFGRARMA